MFRNRGYKDASVETLLGGELGILVDPDDVEELADVLIKVLKKKVPDELLDSNYLKKRTLENFGFTTFKNNLENILKEIT